MLKRGEALRLARAFCRAYMERRDLEATLSLTGEEAVFIGTASHERVFGKEALAEYLRQDFTENPEPFRVRFLEERETAAGLEAALADVVLEMYNDTFCLELQMSAAVAEGADGVLLRHVHYAVPTALQQEGEHYPLTLVRERIARIKEELLDRSMAGGIMGGYIAPGFPFYCINGRMLQYLGYGSEAAFIQDNRGLITNCMHPEDRDRVDREVDRQLSAGAEYMVEYRMRKQDGSYIWVHDVGRAITAEDGRRAILSVCLDITELKETARQLEESRRRYQLAVEGADICIWEYDLLTRRIHQPPGSMWLYGQEAVVEDVPESLIRQGMVREDCVENFRDLFRRLHRGEEKVSGEFWFRRPGQEGEWCERVTYYAVPDETGLPTVAYGAGQDVTRRKEAEHRYEEELRYREKAETTMLSSCRVDLTAEMVEEQYLMGDIRRNIPYGEEFRRNSNRFIQEPSLAEMLYEEMSPARLIARFCKGERSLQHEYLICRSQGERVRVRTTVNLMRRPDSGSILAFFYTKDITREWILENTVETIIGFEYDFISHIDLSTGRYGVVARQHDLPMAPDTVSGWYEQDLERTVRQLPPEEQMSTREALSIPRLKAALETSPTYTFEHDLPDWEGGLRRKQLRFSYADRETGYVIVSQADVEEIVRAEKAKQETLRTALYSAREANRTKSDFMARMSHDMRTPMNGVIGLSRLGLEVETLEEARDFFAKIARSGEYLMLLINDPLEMNRIESGYLKLHPEPLSSRKLFEEVAAMNCYAAEEREITFTASCTEAADRYILADRERTMQIFNNLLSNAIKFTPRGGRVEFLCDCDGETEDGRCRTRAVVRDTGIGMEAGFMEKLFEPFEQENDSTLGEENMGSGLGLSIVKRLVDLMDGDLAVHSEKGKGTEFVVHLAFSGAEAPRAEAELPVGETRSLAGCRVLLCEDHPLNAQITQKMLGKEGVLVDHAENGQVGLDRFAVSHPGYYDAILMDVRMPVLDGLETARRIRALSREDAKTVPILAMTANAFQEDREKSHQAGMNDHLSKPIDPQALYAALRRWMFE